MSLLKYISNINIIEEENNTSKIKEILEKPCHNKLYNNEEIKTVGRIV